LYLRHTRPELHRPFKTPGVPYTPMLGLLSCFYLLGHLPSVTLVRFVIWLGLGLTIYFLFSRKNSILAR
jgi:APA family basic amino acid/polyamine antiporter